MIEENLNLGNAIYEGLNDQNGLMICGYEWGQEADRKEQIIGGVSKSMLTLNEAIIDVKEG